MENIDELKKIWQEDDKNAKKYYDENKENILNKAKQQSNDIISKVRRNIKKDYIINILAIPIFVFWLKMEGFTSFTLIKQLNIIFFIILYVAIYLYSIILLQKHLKKGDLIENVMDSINFRIDILSKFFKRVKILYYASFPWALMLVIYMKPVSNSPFFEGWTAVHYAFVGFVIFLGLAFFYLLHVVSWAIYNSFYGNYLKYLKSIKEKLLQEVDII